MPATPVQPTGWPAPRGYSNGMKAHGSLVAVAGQIGWDAQGRLVEGGFVAQFEQALGNVVTVVRAAGGEPDDILSLTIYVTDRDEYADAAVPIGEVYRRIMGRHYPAMALLVVAGLLEPGAKVEIQALATVEAADA